MKKYRILNCPAYLDFDEKSLFDYMCMKTGSCNGLCEDNCACLTKRLYEKMKECGCELINKFEIEECG